MVANHEQLMELALQEAIAAGEEDNPPFGAVIVEDGEVIARGRNVEGATSDITAHAETMALRNASSETRRTVFTNCTLYTTSDPCPMCLAAMLVAGVSTLVIGAERNASERRWGDYTPEKLIELTKFGGRLEVVRGVLSSKCTVVRDGG